MKPDFRVLRGESFQTVMISYDSLAGLILTRRLKDWPVQRRPQCGLRFVVRKQT